MSKVTVDSGILSKDELKLIQDQQTKQGTIVQQIGVFETQKHQLMHDLAVVNESVSKTKKDLENKYGSINIDLENGHWKRIKEEDVEDKKD
jgi:hypothetical protein|tara:strand:- start:468 stop:740 length:273 start_codon:yes stop_codon:yes gene_type:complete